MKTKLTILFIDDIKDEVEPFMDALKSKGHDVDYRDDPNKGISLACHHYDIIFIDFTFEFYDKDGSQIGVILRKKCPLVPLVLLTAFGKEKIRDFIYVGFDDYFDKHIEGEKATEKKKRLEDCLSVAMANSQKRIKSLYTVEELNTIEIRLDAIESALTTNSKNRSANAILPKVIEYEKTKYGKGHKLTRNRLITTFTLEEKRGSGILNEDALKARQLLITNLTRWENARKHFPKIKFLIEEFNIGN